MASELQLRANRANAAGSTGPQTPNGKVVASRNAVRHGILTGQLLLDHEDPAELEALLRDLHEAMAPVGAVETTLVERIAAAIWRQRRLIAAETGMIQLERRQGAVVDALGRLNDLHLGYDPPASILEPIDDELVSWCRAALAEYEALDAFDLETIKRQAPHILAQIEDDAKDDRQTVEEFAADIGDDFSAYLREFMSWCQRQLHDAEHRPRVQALAEQIRRKKLILPLTQLDLLARYQTTLDNQLYKALRALREAQEWRQSQERSEADGEEQ